ESLDSALETEPLTANLPRDYPVGGKFLDGNRLWQRIRIITGKTGGKWAYWVGASHKAEKIHPNERFEVIADTIFNGDTWHFAGMLAVPYPGKIAGVKDTLAWVLIEPRTKEFRYATTELYKDSMLTLDGKRYEKSREVYDVETKES